MAHHPCKGHYYLISIRSHSPPLTSCLPFLRKSWEVPERAMLSHIFETFHCGVFFSWVNSYPSFKTFHQKAVCLVGSALAEENRIRSDYVWVVNPCLSDLTLLSPFFNLQNGDNSSTSCWDPKGLINGFEQIWKHDKIIKQMRNWTSLLLVIKLVRKNLAIVVIDCKMYFWFTFNVFELRVHFTISGNLTIAAHQVAMTAC